MKKIKILTITLAIVAITMLAFWGVYIQKQNRMENQMHEYDLAMDLTGSRNIRLKVDTENKTIIKDAEGKEGQEENLTDEQIAEKGYQKEDIPNNSEEVKTLENYKTSKEVIEKRLKKLGVSNYIIKLDEQTGDILIELTENEATDEIVSIPTTQGKFEIVDSETKEVLLTNADIEKVSSIPDSSNGITNVSTPVYLQIEFNKEGRKKLEEISNKYVKAEDTPTEETNTTENTENTENSESVTEKKVTMNIDDTEMMSTSFSEPVKTGKLILSIGGTATDIKDLKDNITRAANIATILDTGNIPVKYTLTENQYVVSDILDTQIEIAIYIILGLVVIGVLVLIIKYKKLGILGAISYIGFISVFMIVARNTNVSISIEGIFGMLVTLILNYIFVSQLSARPTERKTVYGEFFVKIIPIIIMAISFSFIQWIPMSSFGMMMFWGIALIAIYNSIVTNSFLRIETRKEK